MEGKPTFSAHMQLYDRDSRRLYLNAEEQRRFLAAALLEPDRQRTFCLTLLYTGCRVSEARALTHTQLQRYLRVLTLHTLKSREPHKFREVPIPQDLIDDLEASFPMVHPPYGPPIIVGRPLWTQGGKPISRTTAYRWVKRVMRKAGIHGAQATCKGLRHGYGIHAIRTGVQLHMLQKGMGHARMETTAIYATAVGKEEQEIADRMWAADEG